MNKGCVYFERGYNGKDISALPKQYHVFFGMPDGTILKMNTPSQCKVRDVAWPEGAVSAWAEISVKYTDEPTTEYKRVGRKYWCGEILEETQTRLRVMCCDGELREVFKEDLVLSPKDVIRQNCGN